MPSYVKKRFGWGAMKSVLIEILIFQFFASGRPKISEKLNFFN
jgi:hypothetical protein